MEEAEPQHVETSNKPQVLDFPIKMMSSVASLSCHNWNFEFLCNTLKDKRMSCRIWRKSNEQVLETMCDQVHVTMEELYNWLQQTGDSGNPLYGYDRQEHAAYIDYKYMKDVFCDNTDLLTQVEWVNYGLPGFDGKESTIWIGSEGSNTSGHQDSYGFNLVTQIQGRKLWVMFPPSDTKFLYPTRIPYEESSVFSEAHLGCLDTSRFPNLKSCHPVVVVLHPGETLYVPRHWWHYVESLSPSISINVWVPHKKDANSHLTESITRYTATALLNEITRTDLLDDKLVKALLNPTETLLPQSENVHYVKSAVDRLLQDPQKDAPMSTDKDDDVISHLKEFYLWLSSFTVVQISSNSLFEFCKCCKATFNSFIINENYDAIIPKNTSEGRHVHKKSVTRSFHSNNELNCDKCLNDMHSCQVGATLNRKRFADESGSVMKKAKDIKLCPFPELVDKSCDVDEKWGQYHGKGNRNFLSANREVFSSSDRNLSKSKPNPSRTCIYSLSIPCTFDQYSHFLNYKTAFCKQQKSFEAKDMDKRSAYGCQDLCQNSIKDKNLSQLPDCQLSLSIPCLDISASVNEIYLTRKESSTLNTKTSLPNTENSNSSCEILLPNIENATSPCKISPSNTESAAFHLTSRCEIPLPNNVRLNSMSPSTSTKLSPFEQAFTSTVISPVKDNEHSPTFSKDLQVTKNKCSLSSIPKDVNDKDNNHANTNSLPSVLTADPSASISLNNSSSPNATSDMFNFTNPDAKEIHKLLYDSILHPSVVKRIAHIFKSKVASFLWEENKNK